MPISLTKANTHVSNWSANFARFPSRASWPPYLFHTAQIEVIVEIIESDGIKCRSSIPHLTCDVANQGALWNNPDAHDYVRLYFRPKNGFHLKTEGIKSKSDVYRTDPHMSIPVALAFDLKKVLTLSDSGFIAGNFALSNQKVLSGDIDFDKLDFNLIYHDSAIPTERKQEILNNRMSEVVVKRFLSLDCLSCVICRTVYEEQMLRQLLRLKNVSPPKILVEQRGAIFFRRGIFISRIWWQEKQLHLQFQTPTTSPQDSYCLDVEGVQSNGVSVRGVWQVAHGGPWRLASLPKDERTWWRIRVEDCVAYEGIVPSSSGLIT